MGETPLDLLYRALNSERGIVVDTADPVKLRAKLYPLRRSDPDLECLSFQISRTNPERELLIVKSPD